MYKHGTFSTKVTKKKQYSINKRFNAFPAHRNDSTYKLIVSPGMCVKGENWTLEGPEYLSEYRNKCLNHLSAQRNALMRHAVQMFKQTNKNVVPIYLPSS